MCGWSPPGSIVEALPFLYALLAWFLGTGAAVWLARSGAGAARTAGSVVLAAAIPPLALGCLVLAARSDGAAAAYVGFTTSLILWGWHELAFLTGAVAGPNARPLAPGLRGLARFRAATNTLIHHELALAATLALAAALTWRAPDHTGTLTFAALFAMRLSAKLNLFAGVPHFDASLLPPALRHLPSYFGRARWTPLLPLSLAALAAAAVLTAHAAIGASTPAAATGYTLVFAMILLGLVEHAFLALPLADARLWRWAIPEPLPVPANPPTKGTRTRTGRVD